MAMFWLETALVIAVLFALAWWLSGRAKPGVDIQHRLDSGPGVEGKARAQTTAQNATGSRSL